MDVQKHLPLISRARVAAAALLAASCSSPGRRVNRVKADLDAGLAKHGYARPGDADEAAARLEDGDLTEAAIASLSTPDLRALGDALRHILLLRPEDERLLVGLRDAFAELRRRGAATEHEELETARALLNGRRLEEAVRALSTTTASLVSIPHSLEPRPPGTAAAGWVHDTDPDWRRPRLGLLASDGPRVYMTMFTGCGVSEAALRELLASTDTAKIMRERGALLMHRFDAKGASLWRRSFSYPRVYIVEGLSSFPDFDFRSSPNFYFTMNGKVVDRFSGWDGAALERWRRAWSKAEEAAPVRKESGVRR
jgi:hypothetical protein